MHFLFPFLIGSKIDDSYRSHKLLSGEEQPEFLRPDYTVLISVDNQLLTFKSAIVQSSKRDYVYYKCDVTITSESKFLNNYGFGKSTSSGFGGALYMYESVFQIVSPDPSKNSIFSGNSAAYGGALCLVSTASYLSNAVFTSNQAYKHAGAVYFENRLISNGRLSNVVQFLGTSLKFSGNTASEYGGAIMIYAASEVYIERSIFNSNRCCFSGGAIRLMNVDSLKLNYVVFSCNVVDAHQTELHIPYKLRQEKGESIDNDFSNKVTSTRFVGRGGGAIGFSSDDKKGNLINGAQTYEKRHFETHHCCFYKDTSTYTGQTFGDGAAHEILIDGYTEFISYDDYIYNFNPNELPSQSVSQVVRTWLEDVTSMVFLGNRFNSDPNTIDLYSGKEDKELTYPTSISYSYATISNVGDSTTSNVASPTEYTYVATAITKLPQKTAGSQTKYSSAKLRIDSPTSYFNPSFVSFTIPPATPHSTAHSTPHSTAHSTPHSTFHSTPHSTAFSTAHSTPHSTAHSTPFSTGHSTSHSTFHSTPHSTAHSTPHSTFHSTPHSTPHITYYLTPYSTVHSTAHRTPFSTFHSTPFQTAFSTPFSTAHSTAHSTPHSTFHSTPHITVYSTPFSTMHYTAHSTPFSTAHSTPSSSRIGTPFITAHSTPHSTAHSTPHSTFHSTPHSTPYITFHSTPHSTAHSTPHSTFHITPFKTAFSTPHSTAHSTAFSTPHSTPHSTAFVTVFSTPHSTAHKTPFDTMSSTPFNTAFETAYSTPFITTHQAPYNTVHRTPDLTVVSISKEELSPTPAATSTLNAEGNTTTKKRSIWPIIVGAICGLLLLALIIFFIIYKKKKAEDAPQEISEESLKSVSEDEHMETYIDTNILVTNENPIWTQSIENGDAFDLDFEEKESFAGIEDQYQEH